MRRAFRRGSAASCLAVLLSAALLQTSAFATAIDPGSLVGPVLGGPVAGDGGSYANALSTPTGLLASSDGTIYLYDHKRIRAVDPSTGTVNTVVGGGTHAIAEGEQALAVRLDQFWSSLALSSTGELSWTGRYDEVWSRGSDGVVHARGTYSGLTYGAPSHVLAYAGDGTLWVRTAQQLYSVAPGSSVGQLRAGGGGGTADGIAASESVLAGPAAVAVASDGAVVVIDGRRIRRMGTNGTVSTIAGTATLYSSPGQPSDGAVATSERLEPFDLAVAPSGEIQFLNDGYVNGSTQVTWLVRLDGAGVLYRVADMAACGNRAFVPRAEDVLSLCSGLHSLPLSSGVTSLPGTALSKNGGRSADGTPVGHAWADSYGSIAKLSDGSLAVVQHGDVVVVSPSGQTSSLQEANYVVTAVVARPSGGLFAVESPLNALTGPIVRALSLDGSTRTTIAGGGSTDPSVGEQQALNVRLPAPMSEVVAPDGTLYFADSQHTYALGSDGVLRPVAGFSDLAPDVRGVLAIDPTDGALHVNDGQHVLRRDAGSGSFTVVTNGLAATQFHIAPDGSFVFVRAGVGPYLTDQVTRVWPDGRSATVAGARAGGWDGLPSLDTTLHIAASALDTDGSLLVVDNSFEDYGGPVGEVRRLPLLTPAFPAAAQGASATGGAGTITLEAPAAPAGTAWCAQVRADGARPHDAYDGEQTICPSEAADGTLHAVVTRLAGKALVAGRTYQVRFALQGPDKTVGPPQVVMATVAPDTSPPSPVNNLQLASLGSSLRVSYNDPSDADIAQTIIRIAPGTVPPATPSDGSDGRTVYAAPGKGEYEAFLTLAGQPYAVSVFAADVSGNVSMSSTALLAAPQVVTSGTTAQFVAFGPVSATDSHQRLDFFTSTGEVSVRYAVGTDAPATTTDGQDLPVTASSRLVLPDAPIGTQFAVSIFTPTGFPSWTHVNRISVVLVTGTPQSFPLAVQGLIATAGNGTASFSWTEPAPGFRGMYTLVRLNKGTVGTVATGIDLTPIDGTAVAMGLAGGQDYVVSVAGQVTGYTAPVQSVVLNGTTLQLVAPMNVVAGQRVAATVTLLRGSTGLVGRSVDLYQRRHGNGVFVKAASATTSTGGVAGFAVAPIVGTDYQVRFAGAARDLGSVSPITSVSVASKVSLTGSPTSAPRGRAVTLTATVGPSKKGQTLVFQRYVSGAWRTYATVRLAVTSTARITIRPTAKGKVKWRAIKSADALNGVGMSPTLVVTTT